MNHSDFRIGGEFVTATGRWRCTDIGTRVIIAIQLGASDSSWYNGPPFAVAEVVFDEYDLEGCSAEVGPIEADTKMAGSTM
jgi:hypothetical protein